MSRIAARVITEVIERADGYCEACGGSWDHTMEFHHRHARGMGGSGNHFPWIDQAVNLLWVHGRCHNLHQGSIHSRRNRSVRLGHIVDYGVDPAAVPVQVARNLLELTQ